MKLKLNTESWETVVIPKKSIVRHFVHEKTGNELAEIVLPDELPKGSSRCGGWHFYMPGGCVEETKDGVTLKFPPFWRTIRFLSPHVKGKRSDSIEYPVEDALALMRDTFAER